MIQGSLAAFLQEGVGIHIATRNAALDPNGTRALAVKVEDDGRHLVVYVAGVAAARILSDLEDNGQAAVGFARPIDDKACQVKGLFLAVRDASDDERPFIARQWDGFLASLEQIGIPRAATRAWITWPAVAIRLRVNALFDQTPGPGAGSQITSTPS
jgi:hypothetical protein